VTGAVRPADRAQQITGRDIEAGKQAPFACHDT
jgi:hypothetical protein